MSYLLQETITIMEQHGKAPADVRWIGNRVAINAYEYVGEGDTGDYVTDWQTFEQLASQPGDKYTGYAYADDLIVVGDDWWLERHEYDGAQWWEFKTLPVIQGKRMPILSLEGSDLARIHRKLAQD